MALEHLGIYAIKSHLSDKTKVSYFLEGRFGNFIIGEAFKLTDEISWLLKTRGGVAKVLNFQNFTREQEMTHLFNRFGASEVVFKDNLKLSEFFPKEIWGMDYYHIDFIEVFVEDFKGLLITKNNRSILFVNDHIAIKDNELIFSSPELELKVKTQLNLFLGKIDFVLGTNIISGNSAVAMTDEIYKDKLCL